MKWIHGLCLVLLLKSLLSATVAPAQQARQPTIEELQQSAMESKAFTQAIGNEALLQAYIRSCRQCDFVRQAKEMAESLHQDTLSRDLEEVRYSLLENSIDDLQSYLKDCRVCEFAQQARDRIKELRGSDVRLFDLEVCNRDPLPVWVAYMGRIDAIANVWIATGWFKVASNECETVGQLARGDFFLRAYNARGVWTGEDKHKYCVSRKAFKHIVPDGDECLDGENQEDLGKHTTDQSKYTWTLDSTPFKFAALAYSPSNNAWGWAHDYPSAQEAQDAAIGFCAQNAADCKIANWARDDMCLALAQGYQDGEQVLGWAVENSRGYSERTALQSCRAIPGQGCRILQSSCR